jgi:hypothetical protein
LYWLWKRKSERGVKACNAESSTRAQSARAVRASRSLSRRPRACLRRSSDEQSQDAPSAASVEGGKDAVARSRASLSAGRPGTCIGAGSWQNSVGAWRARRTWWQCRACSSGVLLTAWSKRRTSGARSSTCASAAPLFFAIREPAFASPPKRHRPTERV